MKFNADILHGLASLGGIAGSAAWKGLIILAVAWGVTLIWRRGNPAARHLVWTATFICLLILPFLGRFTPSWHSPAWADPTALNDRLPESLRFVLNGSASQPSASATPMVEKQTAAVPTQPVSPTSSPDRRRPVTWSELAMAIWLIGVVIGLLRILTAQIQLRRWTRSMRASESSEQLRIMEELQADFQLHRPVQLLVGSEFAAPMTWGIWRPVVVLPAAAHAWPDERLRVVLRHELAHICRRDCLTQEIARVACVLYWFNPLTWLAARQMRVEREKACDDLVLNAGARPSAYAGHLVEIARQFSALAPGGGTVAMARPSGLEQRVAAILDARRPRKTVGKVTASLIALLVFGLGILLGGCVTGAASKPAALKPATSAQLAKFAAEKEMQESQLIKTDEADFAKSYDSKRSKMVVPDCRPFFAAAARGDWPAVSNLWSKLEAHTLGVGLKQSTNGYPHGMWLQPVRETFGAVKQFVAGSEKYATAFGHDIIQSIPPGSIYFGGTDPGRFIVTMMEKSQVNADPFFMLTQNALADGTYLEYLRSMYGDKIYIPTSADSQRCFEDYTSDIRKRMAAHQLKPGEHIEQDQGRIQISGQGAVMQINGLLAKVIFDQNTNREFYIEQSWPLNWMYPYLEPHGLIMKINRQPLPELSDAMVQQDRKYWQPRVAGMIGGWLNEDTSVKAVADFAEKVFVRHDLDGFTGDPEFVQNDYANKMFSKLRSSIAGLYAWRAEHATAAAEKARMVQAADFAFRQALALCPGNPEVVQRYGDFLKSQNRLADAKLVSDLAQRFTLQPKSISELDWTNWNNGQAIGSFYAVAGTPTETVAVGIDGRIATRNNLTGVWKIQTFTGDPDFRAVVHANGKYVVVREGGSIMTSPDGIVWTKRVSPTTKNLLGLFWDGHQFMAGGDHGTILTSPDGINWTPQSSGSDINFYSFSYSGLRYVAVGNDGILISADSLTWKRPQNWVETARVPFTACVWTGQEFLACGLGLDRLPTIYTSPDGEVWTLRDSTVINSLRAAIVLNGVIYVAGDSVIKESTDGGSTWQDTYANPTGSEIFMGLAFNGQSLITAGFNHNVWAVQP